MIVFERGVPGSDHVGLAEPGFFYVTDLDHRSFFCPARWDAEHIYLDPPSDAPLAIHVRFAAPGYGPLWLTADNGGMGYTADGRTRRLLAELASSRVALSYRLARDIGETAAVASLLADLPANASDSSVVDIGEAATLLGHAIHVSEDIEQALSQRRGRGPALLSGTLFGERLGPYAIGVGPDWPSNATPDFLRRPEEWPFIARACQATTLPNFWRWVEFQPGVFNWSPLDKIMDFAQANSMSVKSFALYWGGLGSVPPWFRHLTYAQQKDAIMRWVETLVGRYRGRIDAWETVNEMHDWPFGNRFNWSHTQLLEITQLVTELTGQLDPGTPRVINHSSPWGEILQLSGMQNRWNPRTYLEEVIAQGIAFEGIGLQFYNPGRDMVEMAQQLDRFITLGKRIYITEMGTPSAQATAAIETAQVGVTDGWRSTWTLQTQAEWIERFLTLAVARPEVAVINYWDMDDERSFIRAAGLLDANGRPKPGYEAWMRLHPSRTTAHGST